MAGCYVLRKHGEGKCIMTYVMCIACEKGIGPEKEPYFLNHYIQRSANSVARRNYEKIAQNEAQPIYCRNLCITFTVEKADQKFGLIL
jgi:hypothetical protein